MPQREPVVVLEDLLRASKNLLSGTKNKDTIIILKRHIEEYTVALNALKTNGEVK